MASEVGTICRSSDEAFDLLLEEFTVQIQAGLPVDLGACASAHPEYAERLRKLMPALQALMVLGGVNQTHTEQSPSDISLRPTSGVLGDFRIVREIGRGGMGIVYEAEQISIGRPVALKVLPFASMLDERRLARFRNEVRAAGQLHHTNIVPIHAVGSDRGVHFYAMQLVPGHTLADIIAELRATRRIEERRTNSPVGAEVVASSGDTVRAALSTLGANGGTAFYRTVAQVAIQAAEALEHAHSSGIIHRDIKPSNLLVDERENLWLTDFGLASIDSVSDLTMSGDLLGTLRYMSPEQTLGSRVVLDHRTDIYSLGVTIYELLTLKPAFDSSEHGELLREIAVFEPPSPRRLDAAIPQDLETIVLKAMAKDATARYESAQHMADDLRRFLENKPIAARRPSFVERGRKWTARHSALVTTAAGSFALISVVSAAATFFTMRAYTSETKQRDVAESNLAVASKIIDRMLSRVADDRYYRGDLEEAEQLAADATQLYEELLKHNDDPDLRFRAARAHSDVAHIWRLVGRHEKASIAARRAGQLLLRLTTQHPGRAEYLSSLAANYNQIGLIDWSLDRPMAAEPSFRQAWEVFAELNQSFPNNPGYQNGLAMMLSNLGSVCYFSNRFEQAEEYYRRAEVISEQLPDELKSSAEGLASQAGSCTNQAELARLRGQYDRALELLEQSIPLHKQSLEKWPTNPVALDCYFHTHWSIVECQLGLGRPAEAAAAVERLVATFPNRLSAYHAGAAQLLRCAALDEKEHGEGEAPVEPKSSAVAVSDADNVLADQGSLASETPRAVVTYRQRAREFIAKAHAVPDCTPEAAERFAWFLVTCPDKSFRDPHRALELARNVTKDIPQRGSAWFTLALAHYRNGEWQAADDAVQNTTNSSASAEAKAYNRLLLAMIRWQQGRTDESRELYETASAFTVQNRNGDDELLTFVAEAAELIHGDNSE